MHDEENVPFPSSFVSMNFYTTKKIFFFRSSLPQQQREREIHELKSTNEYLGRNLNDLQ
jgi:DNA-binding transcriptional regulator GbsR (MarR family)